MPLPRTGPIRFIGLAAMLALVVTPLWSTMSPAAGAAPAGLGQAATRQAALSQAAASQAATSQAALSQSALSQSALSQAALSQAALGRHWHWPLDPPWRIVGPFVAPATPYGSGHRGIDLAAPPGAAVYSPADGEVYLTGTVVNRPVLSIRHSDGLLSSFEPVTSTLTAGDVVRRGDRIGTVEPGHCPTVCLHFGVRLHGQYVSPLKYLSGIPHSVLLPVRPLP